MMRFARLVLQLGVAPPINININLPQRRQKPLAEITIPKKPGFDPKRQVDNRAARMLAASNALEGKEPR